MTLRLHSDPKHQVNFQIILFFSLLSLQFSLTWSVLILFLIQKFLLCFI